MLNTSIICILVTIVAYLLIVLLIGFHYAKVNESASDFYLGGRKLGPLVTAMSAEASDMSSYLLMGLPGLARDRTGDRNLFKLAFYSKTPAPLYARDQVVYAATVFLESLS